MRPLLPEAMKHPAMNSITSSKQNEHKEEIELSSKIKQKELILMSVKLLSH